MPRYRRFQITQKDIDGNHPLRQYVASGLLQTLSDANYKADGILQVSFFIVVSSSNDYAKHLGGGSTFAGIVIGIPTVFSGIALVPMMQHDRGKCTPLAGWKREY